MYETEYERIFEYSNIRNIDIRIQFVAIFKAEYYSNIQKFFYEYFRKLVFKNHLKYSRFCKRSGTFFKSLLFWLAGEVNWLAVEVLSPCQK